MSIKDETRYQYNLTLRRDTKRNWRLANPVLLSGEIGIEYKDITVSDGEETAEFPTASNNQKMVSFKVGNGVDGWNDLPYASGEQGVAGEQGDPLRVDELDTIDRRYLFDDRTKGFSFLAIDEGKIYFKLTNGIGDWTEGFPFGQGKKGEKGTSIESIKFTSTTHESGLPHQSDAIDTYTITLDNGNTEDFKIQNGTVMKWSEDSTPYPINAQVYYNDKWWIALRANSVEPTEGADWTEFKVTTTPTANAVPQAGADGRLAVGWFGSMLCNVRTVITTSGTYTYPRDGWYRKKVIGAGGAGGSGMLSNYSGVQGGGGGAGQVKTALEWHNAGKKESVIIGAGGVPGAIGANGGDGGNTSIGSVTAVGAEGGKNNGGTSYLASSQGGKGYGSGSPGTGFFVNSNGAGCQGTGGTGGSNGTDFGGGGGGGSVWANGVKGAPGVGSSNGLDGTYGTANGIAGVGGRGGNGAVIIEYFDPSVIS